MKKDYRKSAYYPIFLNISGKKCVVAGGGQVALRKVKTLLEHDADVTVISPEPCPEIAAMAAEGQVKTFQRNYQPGDMEGAFVAIAATDDKETNSQVAKEARAQKALVNVADDPESSDFIVPACARRGDINIAVSTSAKSPALARKIRDRLEKELGEEYAVLARIIGETREELKQKGLKITSESWQQAIDLELMLGLLKKDNEEKARAVLRENLKSELK